MSGRLVLRRLLWALPTLFVIYTVTFFVMHATPGGPWDDGARNLHPAIIENIRQQFHLDKPLWYRYGIYLVKVVRDGDLGPSYDAGGRMVSEILADFFPVSAQLGLAALLASVVFGVLLGVCGAVYRDRFLDHVATFLAVVGVSTPNFVVAILLVVIFGVELGWVSLGAWQGIWSGRALLAVIALSLSPMAMIARYTRSSLLDVLTSDFIRTARAKGLPERVVLYRHALPNAMISVTTVAGISLVQLVTGSFFVETITMVPGIGRYFVGSVFARDYPVIMGLTLLYAVLIVSMNTVVDICYAILDPRIRFD